MIVLNTNTPQTLKVIPRIYESAFQVAYTDDSTNVRTEVSIKTEYFAQMKPLIKRLINIMI